MFGVLFSATPFRSASVHTGSRAGLTASASIVRWLITLSVALALASAPTMGVAWPDAATGDSGEPGAAAGVVPFVADPGHRMGGATFGSSAPSTAGSVTTESVRPVRPPTTDDRPGIEAFYHRWLRNMLAGSRLQTDGG